MSTHYRIEYQLGGISDQTHRKLSAAVREMEAKERRCRKDHDEQRVNVVAYDDGQERDFTAAELSEYRLLTGDYAV